MSHNQYINSHYGRLPTNRSLHFAILLFVLLNLITFRATTTEAAPLLLVPRRSAIVSATLRDRDGKRGGNGGSGSGGVGVDIGSGGGLPLLKLRKPFFPRDDSEGKQTELKSKPQRVDETNQVVGLAKYITLPHSRRADSSNADEVEPPHRTYKTLPLEPSAEKPRMEKRLESVDERDYVPKGTGSGGSYDKNTPYGRK
ncbi:hypothetical protein BGZ79_011157 [Entomortierella chlamydospora]|nr:hypothetical protein BGZ79_011157 [Entomortierella chlamydospora]